MRIKQFFNEFTIKLDDGSKFSTTDKLENYKLNEKKEVIYDKLKAEDKKKILNSYRKMMGYSFNR